MVFLPHTNTVILREPYCGTITERGLPVVLFTDPVSERRQTRVSYEQNGFRFATVTNKEISQII